jgi:enolase
MAMAAASALPLGRLAGALKRYDPVMSNIDVYRGAETAEIKPRDFPGVFVSKDQAIAKQYGKVHQFDLDESARILPLESSETQKLTQEFFKKYPEAEDFINDPDDPAELFMFPTEEWATFLSEKGYDGTSIGDDIFVKNLKKLKGKQK